MFNFFAKAFFCMTFAVLLRNSRQTNTQKGYQEILQSIQSNGHSISFVLNFLNSLQSQENDIAEEIEGRTDKNDICGDANFLQRNPSLDNTLGQRNLSVDDTLRQRNDSSPTGSLSQNLVTKRIWRPFSINEQEISETPASNSTENGIAKKQKTAETQATKSSSSPISSSSENLDNFTVSFSVEDIIKTPQAYTFTMKKTQTIMQQVISVYPRIKSESFEQILQFPFVSNVYLLWHLGNPKEDTTQNSLNLLSSIVKVVQKMPQDNYLSYFAFSKRSVKSMENKFNLSLFFLVSFFCDSRNFTPSNVSLFKPFLQNLFNHCPLDKSIVDEFHELFHTMNSTFKIDLNSRYRPNSKYCFEYSIPLINLIYLESRNQKNEALKACLAKIWEKTTGKLGNVTKGNMSRYYQLELFKRISNINKEMETLMINIERSSQVNLSILSLFTDLDKLIIDFASIKFRYPCRLMSRKNIGLFIKFSASVSKLVENTTSPSFLILIYKCICEFEMFFRCQYSFYIRDFVLELRKSNVKETNARIISNSWKVVRNVHLPTKMQKIKSQIRERLTDDERNSTEEIKITLDSIISENWNVSQDFQMGGHSKEFLYSGFEVREHLDAIADLIESTHTTECSFREFVMKDKSFELESLSLFFKNPKKRNLADHKLFLKKYVDYFQVSFL